MTTTVQLREPYVGLRPLAQDESVLFRGRERDVTRLSNQVLGSRVLVLYAPGGVGKTSLLRAGMLPRIEQHPSVAPVYFDNWSGDPVEELRKRLDDGGTGSVPLYDAAARYLDREKRAPILILDQLEDLVRYPEQMLRMWEEIAPIANVPRSPARVVLTLREDYLGMLEGLMKRVPGLMDNRLRLEPLTEDGARQAIKIPPSQVSPSYDVEDTLVEAIISDFRRSRVVAATTAPIEPGYLQLVCRRLWELERDAARRTIRLETYEREGRAETIIEASIRRTIDECLNEEDREMFFALSRYLVSPSGARMSLTVRDLTEWVGWQDFTAFGREWLRAAIDESRPHPLSSMDNQVESALAALCAEKVWVLRRKRIGDQALYELYHELLGPILLEWRQAYSARRQDALLKEREEASFALGSELAGLMPSGGVGELLAAPEGQEKLRSLVASSPAELASGSREEKLKAARKIIGQWKSSIGKKEDSE